ncbi:MAG: DinB family protein [Acidobacteriota bacterium]|nr:DinB family protein [Acidobacteriota bacterium]
MTTDLTPLREHLVRLLGWEEAHAGFDRATDGIPAALEGARAAGFEHSPWQLLEHLRIAQRDLLDFCVNPRYVHAREWPGDYWPPTASPPSETAWEESVAAVQADRAALCELARNPDVDLFATVPTGHGPQTYLRALLLVADHNAYHVGQLVALRRALGAWPEPAAQEGG